MAPASDGSRMRIGFLIRVPLYTGTALLRLPAQLKPRETKRNSLHIWMFELQVTTDRSLRPCAREHIFFALNHSTTESSEGVPPAAHNVPDVLGEGKRRRHAAGGWRQRCSGCSVRDHAALQCFFVHATDQRL